MEKKKLTARILLILYIITLCVLCFIRIEPGIDLGSAWLGLPKDKIVHFLMFLPYPVITYFAFRREKITPVPFILFMVSVIVTGIAIGAATEIIQGMTNYRSADINDLRADSLGVFSGALIILLYAVISKR